MSTPVQDRFDARPSASRKLNRLPQNPEEAEGQRAVGLGRFPSWLHRKLPKGGKLWETQDIVEGNRLHTVCEEAKCPNLLECWTKKTATFLAMGKECTRACGFCDIAHSKAPAPLESDEPQRIADSTKRLGLEHVVITMVARDDIPDGGGAHLAEIIRSIHRECPGCSVEVLTSDFSGNLDAVDAVLEAGPAIFNYNLETVRELTPRVRHKATYERTLSILRHVKKRQPELFVKSGIMVGLGETDSQVHQAIDDLREVACDIITIGQYLQPSRKKLRVQAFITPEQFAAYEAYGKQQGVPYMHCGPFVRSSYNAAEVRKAISKK